MKEIDLKKKIMNDNERNHSKENKSIRSNLNSTVLGQRPNVLRRQVSVQMPATMAIAVAVDSEKGGANCCAAVASKSIATGTGTGKSVTRSN